MVVSTKLKILVNMTTSSPNGRTKSLKPPPTTTYHHLVVTKKTFPGGLYKKHLSHPNSGWFENFNQRYHQHSTLTQIIGAMDWLWLKTKTSQSLDTLLLFPIENPFKESWITINHHPKTLHGPSFSSEHNENEIPIGSMYGDMFTYMKPIKNQAKCR